jgi:DNA processing protein
MDLLSIVAVSMLAVSRGRASAAFKEIRHLPGVDPLRAVLEACHVPPRDRPKSIAEALDRAQRALEQAGGAGIDAIPWGDPRYPPLLGCILDPPPVLWARGAPDVLCRPTVAVIGSRAATPYAVQVGERLGEELADRGIVVASGLARGVDSAAHRGCLSAGGATTAVLGSGVDRIYPSEHTGLSKSIRKQGVLVSELGPDAPPLAEHFPLRNRIISGISLAVVVVEASEKSGSLITARCALEQGRDVMAVPGSVLSGRNRGSHSLLKDGAKVVETADDILEGLGWPAVRASAIPSLRSPETDPLLARIEVGEEYSLEELSALTGISGAHLLPRLMELELAGVVAPLAGGRFMRVDRRP